VRDNIFRISKWLPTTLRNAKTATVNDWGPFAMWTASFYRAPTRENLEIFDRIGGGDSFASGLIYGFLTDKGPQYAVRLRRGARRAGDDDTGRYYDGNARRKWKSS